MTILVVGASGATGHLLTRELLARGHEVRIIVRSRERLPEDIREHAALTVAEASLLDLSGAELAMQVAGCDAVASCLGHNLTFRGIYGSPRRLVTEAARRLIEAIRSHKPERPVKYVLMNTTGVRNRDLREKISFAQKVVIFLLRTLLPPHADNEEAADFLRTRIGQIDAEIEWAAVRPDGLINADQPSPIEVHPSPTRSAIFNAGKTSRVNVAHFMADLVTEPELWAEWKGKMPVVYNRSDDA